MNKADQKDQALSPVDQIEQAFRDAEDRLAQACKKERDSVLKNHRVQLRSAKVQADYYSVPAVETAEGYMLYLKILVSKPLYRKLDLLAQLQDATLTTCITDMIAYGIDMMLDNSEFLASSIRQRILEEAYGAGSLPQHARQKVIEEARAREKM